MNLIHSKDIYLIGRDILKCIDPRVVNHGERTAYITYRMLQSQGKYEMYEIAEFAFIAMLHDIGAFKTDKETEILQYETKTPAPHSIFGYLYLTYLTPFKDRAKILLYHHTDYNQVPPNGYEFDDVIHIVSIAEKMDLYSNILGDKFDANIFDKHAGVKYSKESLILFHEANKRYGILSKLSTGEYKKELSELLDYLIFTDEEKHELLLGLMLSLGFRSEYTMCDTVICTNICMQLADRFMLTVEERESLYYAALLHDAGMVSIPTEIIEAPRKLTDEEMKTLRGHVDVADKILRGRVDESILNIVLTHHERADGSGYPRKLRDFSRLQCILQVADTVTGLTAQRSYRQPKGKEAVCAILGEEGMHGRLSQEVCRAVINNYDTIEAGVKAKSDETLATYKKLMDHYEAASKKYKK